MTTTPPALVAAGLLSLSFVTAAAAQRPGDSYGPRQEAEERFERTAPKIGEQMPNLQIYDAEGKEIWLHDALTGHPSVLILGCLT